MASNEPKIRNYGFLTPITREYLQTQYQNKEISVAEKNKIKQYDYRIEHHVKQVLKDLILVAETYPSKKIEKMFTIDDLESLLHAVVTQEGDKITPRGKFYQILVKAIASSMNEHLVMKTRTIVECHISESPAGRGYESFELH